MKKLNCWEFRNCGREPGGKNAIEFGICPCAKKSDYTGVNGGKYSGRFCWAVAGTYCKGEIQGSFAKKFKDCVNCNFLKYVQEEEGRSFLLYIKQQKKK